MSFQRFIERLLPKEAHFYSFLENQALIARDAAELLGQVSKEGADFEAIRQQVKQKEREGDKVHDALMSALAATFVTPIDREDLQRLSRRFDSITDLLDVAARSFLIFNVDKPSPAIAELTQLILESVTVLAEVAPLLRANRYDELIERSRKVTEIEKKGDQVFRLELSRLFRDDGIDAKEILRTREILDRLEQALDKCEQAAETMTNIAVKHA